MATIDSTTDSTTNSLLGGSVQSAVGGVVEDVFSPLDLSPLLWIDPSDETTISEATASGRVSQIDDKSGNDEHLLCSTASSQPRTGVNTLNGLNVMSGAVGAKTFLDTVGDQTGSLTGLNSSDFEIHMVHQLTAGQSVESLLALKAATGGDFLVSSWRNGSGTITPEDANNYWFAGSLFAQGTPWVMGFGLTATEAALYRNGTEVNSQGTLPAAPAAFDRFVLFCRIAGSAQFFGDMGEIVVTNRLSTDDRAALSTYLTDKWIGA